MFEELLGRLAAALDAAGIPYMVIGGQAVLLYGEPRLTRDIDITLGVTTDRLPDILALAEGLALNPLPEDPESFAEQTMVLPLGHPRTGIRVDFVFSFTPYEREAIGRSRTLEIAGVSVRFAEPEDLIVHKIFAGRARDLDDVRSVLHRQRNLDVEAIRRRLKMFGTQEDGTTFVSVFEGLLSEPPEAKPLTRRRRTTDSE